MFRGTRSSRKPSSDHGEPSRSQHTLDRRLKLIAGLGQETIPDQAARMIRTRLDPRRPPGPRTPQTAAWAHMLGFRGHFSTKTRAYSTTLGALRDARAAWHRRHAPAPEATTPVLAHWAFGGTGLTPDLERLASLVGGTLPEAVTTDA
ncbi:replication initiator [Streptomyces sp. NPDC048430]|uniref:replication initiator n=1 Tax=Streptomyces sp. NPDC048430 TaxID=3155388 RepID=UPI0034433B9F